MRSPGRAVRPCAKLTNGFSTIPEPGSAQRSTRSWAPRVLALRQPTPWQYGTRPFQRRRTRHPAIHSTGASLQQNAGHPTILSGSEAWHLHHKSSRAAPKPAQRKPAKARERRNAFSKHVGGRLVGRPDHYDGRTITEYKSALPDPGWVGAAAIIENFRRQLRLYAAIIGEATGRRPAAARVIAASGQRLDTDINPDACDDEADAAVAALEALNENLKSGARPAVIASPSATSCSGCPFKIICPPFWDSLHDATMQSLSDTAMNGTLSALEDGPDGDLYTAHVSVHSASLALDAQQPIVLRKSVHGPFDPAAVGQQIRAIDFRVTPDGRIRAGLPTVVAASASMPMLDNAVCAARPS